MTDIGLASKKFRGWRRFGIAAPLIGLTLLFCVYLFSSNELNLIYSIFFCICTASLGSIIGFLFGLPRSTHIEPNTQGNKSKNSKETNDEILPYHSNTNLELISDWVTKLLLGVGLAQAYRFTEILENLEKNIAPYFIGYEYLPNLYLMVMIYFFVVGFSFVYLWTRTSFFGELTRYEVANIRSRLRNSEQKVNDIEKHFSDQAEIDAAALSAATKLLEDEDAGHRKIDITDKNEVDRLKSCIKKASPFVRIVIFYRARLVRSNNYKSNISRYIVDRTIPVFESLSDSDFENRFHRNHAELAFALKDSTSPNFERAQSELDLAIQIRGKGMGWEIYEFNRAICKIKLSNNFMKRNPSSGDEFLSIYNDLEVARTAFPDLKNHEDIAIWLQLNHENLTNLGNPRTPSASSGHPASGRT